MRRSTLYLAFTLFLTISCSLGCKKRSATSTPENPESPSPVVPVVPKPPEPESKRMTPQSLTAENQKIDLAYDADQILLTEIRQSNGTRERIIYKDKHHPKQYQRYLKDELQYQVDYIMSTEGLITRAIQNTVSAGGKVMTPMGAYDISYNDDKQIERVDWYDHQNMLQKSKTYSYNDGKLLTSAAVVIPKGNTETYDYDDKHGIFDQVPFLNVLALENEAFFLKNVQANLKHISNNSQPSEALSFELQYNTTGYPSAIKQTNSSGKSSTYKINYK